MLGEVRQELGGAEMVGRCWEGEGVVRQVLVGTGSVVRCWEGEEGGQAGAGGYWECSQVLGG